MRGQPLTGDEIEVWRAWQRVTGRVRAGVARDVADATGLSEPDHGVLARLVDLGQGSLRQQVLADSMDWHKSRLSHHLTRMEQRGFVTREPAGPGATTVVITCVGRAALDSARPVHAAAVRTHLLAALPPDLRAAVLGMAARLDESGGGGQV
jgi:DNA-binding MarR family transcriptional regulator